MRNQSARLLTEPAQPTLERSDSWLSSPSLRRHGHEMMKLSGHVKYRCEWSSGHFSMQKRTYLVGLRAILWLLPIVQQPFFGRAQL